MHNSFFLYVYFNSLYIFEQSCAHHQESQLYQYDIWYMSLYIGDCLYQTITYTERHIPDVVLIQLNLLMMST